MIPRDTCPCSASTESKRSGADGRTTARSRRPAGGIDVGLVACLALTTLALGGRHDAGRFVYVASIGLATLSLLVKVVLTGGRLHLPRLPVAVGLAAVALLGLQLTPLPTDLLGVLAPGHAGLLPQWTSETALGLWPTISLTPSETVEGLAILLAHLLLFIVVVNRFRTESEIRLLLAAIGVASVALAGIATAQKASGSERLLGLYDVPQWRFDGAVKGTLANRNHTAHFLVLGGSALCAVALLRQESPARAASRRISTPWESSLARGGIALVIAVALATGSRGGAAALGCAAAAIAFVRWRGGLLQRREVLSAALLATLVLAGVSLVGDQRVTSRLDDLVSGDLERLDSTNGRRLIWAANARAFAGNPWFGHGAGSHRFVYPAYIEGGSSLEFTHAESSYLQIATEGGGVGLGVVLVFIGVLGWRIARGVGRSRTAERNALWAALAGGFAAAVTHAVVDFIWFIPVIAGLAAAFAAAIWRLSELPADESARHARPASRGEKRFPPRNLAAACVLAATSAFALACLWGPAAASLEADGYLRASKTGRRLQARRFDPMRSDNDPQLQSTIADADRRAIESLESLLLSDPNNARMNARLASRYARRFEETVAGGANPMTIDSIRDVVRNGGFADHGAAREWLKTAFGDAVALLSRAQLHARRALRLCPLQGECYLQLATLAFLDETSPARDRLIEQALTLRPCDGRIHIRSGPTAASGGAA